MACLCRDHGLRGQDYIGFDAAAGNAAFEQAIGADGEMAAFAARR